METSCCLLFNQTSTHHTGRAGTRHKRQQEINEHQIEDKTEQERPGKQEWPPELEVPPETNTEQDIDGRRKHGSESERDTTDAGE